jgi:enamine deaminase RidA (YjgF/YER057c/UK114 family)
MKMQHIQPPGVSSIPVYTQLVTISDATLLFLAGQVAWDERGQLVGEDDLRAQAIQAFENIRKVLEAVDADFTSVIKLTTYIVGYLPQHRDIYVDVLGQFVAIGHNPPASTLLGVQALAMPGLLIEIEAIAAVSPS